ncbi:hypothetical protein [Nocardioides sp. R-C-SC26]|uniref:hypothetical protein n=1 Tax=Nocardioides sp. R-C-SC26 TaxID=2870414 RepID=UPI001E2E8EF6|nr:hypothetical protein [Nocardioides sp. R-C-SC26]
MSQFPTDVVYGIYANDLLTFLPADYARGASDEVQRWRKVTTWGDALQLASDVRWVGPPFEPGEAAAEYEADEPFDINDFELWPVPAATVALELAGDDWPIGQERSTFMADSYLEMTPADEPALVTLFAQRGVSAVRDDALIARASGHQ